MKPEKLELEQVDIPQTEEYYLLLGRWNDEWDTEDKGSWSCLEFSKKMKRIDAGREATMHMVKEMKLFKVEIPV